MFCLHSRGVMIQEFSHITVGFISFFILFEGTLAGEESEVSQQPRFKPTDVKRTAVLFIIIALCVIIPLLLIWLLSTRARRLHQQSQHLSEKKREQLQRLQQLSSNLVDMGCKLPKNLSDEGVEKVKQLKHRTPSIRYHETQHASAERISDLELKTVYSDPPEQSKSTSSSQMKDFIQEKDNLFHLDSMEKAFDQYNSNGANSNQKLR